jgi:hypothetical protein
VGASGSVDDSTRTTYDDTDSVCLLARLQEIALICIKLHRVAAVRTLAMAALFTIGFGAPFQVFAQSSSLRHPGTQRIAYFKPTANSTTLVFNHRSKVDDHPSTTS